jgi:ABC-type sugar transport system ATPase subunit
MGGQSLLEIDIAKNNLIAEIEGRILPNPGEIMRFRIDLNRLHLFHPETEKVMV